MSLDLEKKRAEKQGDVLLGGAFKGAVRNVDMSGLAKGDSWVFPQTYEVYQTKIGNNTAEYIFIETKLGEVKRFFPSIFTKVRTIVNEDGTSTGARKSTSGTAVEEFRKYASVDEAMNALKGKEVIITDVAEVRCLRYGTTEVITDRLPQIDFVA